MKRTCSKQIASDRSHKNRKNRRTNLLLGIMLLMLMCGPWALLCIVYAEDDTTIYTVEDVPIEDADDEEAEISADIVDSPESEFSEEPADEIQQDLSDDDLINVDETSNNDENDGVNDEKPPTGDTGELAISISGKGYVTVSAEGYSDQEVYYYNSPQTLTFNVDTEVSITAHPNDGYHTASESPTLPITIQQDPLEYSVTFSFTSPTFTIKKSNLHWNGYNLGYYYNLTKEGSSDTYFAICAQASQDHGPEPNSTYPGDEYSDSDKANVIKYALMTYLLDGVGITGHYEFSKQFSLSYDALHMFCSWVYDGQVYNGVSVLPGMETCYSDILNYIKDTAAAIYPYITDGTLNLDLATLYILKTGSGTQDIIGISEKVEVVPSGSLILKKSSNLPDITDNNACYRLEGTVYGVYADENCSISLGELTIASDGTSSVLELLAGTYWVKEISAGSGYALDTSVYQVTVRSGETTTCELKDTPQNNPVSLLVQKLDTETNSTVAQGDGSMAEAQYTVKYYDTLNESEVEGMSPLKTWVFETDEDGYILLSNNYLVGGDDLYYSSTGIPTLPLGTYVIQESKAPEGYLLDVNVYTVVVDSNGATTETVESYQAPLSPEQVIRGGVAVQKLDDTTEEIPQGDADFSGITFEIINNSKNAVVVNGTSYEPGKVVATITTNESGYAATATNALPYGSYTIHEVTTNSSYLNTAQDISVTISEEGVLYEYTAENAVVRNGLEVQKLDTDSQLNAALGGASVEGAVFEITNASEHIVYVDTDGDGEYEAFAPGSPIMTITSEFWDSNGDGEITRDGQDECVATTDTDHDGYDLTLPYGTYTIKEIQAPKGYLLTDEEITLTLHAENGAVITPATTEDQIDNQVIRGDLELQKSEEISEGSMSYIPFLITLLDSEGGMVESHVLVTDINGMASTASAWNSHSEKTNANDAAYDAATGTVDESLLDPEAGIWFGETVEGWLTDANNALGALPYGTYLIEELPVSGNEGYQLVSKAVFIYKNGYTLSFDMDDVAPEFHTYAFDLSDYDKELPAGEAATIVDIITYSDLKKGDTYTFKTSLVDKETGKAILDAEGNEVSGEYRFTADATAGMVRVELTLDTGDLAGRELVVFEELYDSSDRLIAEERSTENTEQTVQVPEPEPNPTPEIHTTATDGYDGDKEISTEPEVTVVDTVKYSGLTPGAEYTITGVLMLKVYDEDGNVSEEVLCDADGSPVFASTTFTPASSDGSIDITFTFDAKMLSEGQEIVAFETLYYQETEIAVHADIEDADQTVTVVVPEEPEPEEPEPAAPEIENKPTSNTPVSSSYGKTGVSILYFVVLAIVLVATGIGAARIILKKQRYWTW